MSLKARWRLAELDADTDNPFDRVVLSTGLKVDMGGGEEAIHQGIAASLKLEAALFDRGVVCALKDDGQDCLTCHSYNADPVESLSKLCRLGRDQRDLEGRHQVLVEERHRPYRELAEPYIEMAAGHAELFALL